MSEEVDEALRNAINVEIKEKYGDDAFQRNTIVISLVEFPADPKGKPDQPRVRMMVKALQPIQLKTASVMLQQAAVQFQRNQETTT